ncbi:MAG: alpha/beta hydrolase [Bacteroidota bacterium]
MNARFLFLVCCSLMLACQPMDLSRLKERITIRRAGADMPAYIHGNGSEGTFLIVLHGAGSFGLAFREGIFKDHLEEDYAVVYFDQRGQGMAQGNYEEPDPNDPDAPHLVDEMALDIMALAWALEEKFGEDIDIFLLGHSFGGLLGTRIVSDPVYAPTFTGWINVAGLHNLAIADSARAVEMTTIAEEEIALDHRTRDWQALADKINALEASDENYHWDILDCARTATRYAKEEGLTSAEQVSSALIWETFFNNNPINWKVSDHFQHPVDVARESQYSLSAVLSNIQLPTLLLYGKYDFSVPLIFGRENLNLIGSQEKALVILEKSAHHPFLSQPEEVLQEISSFIELYR